MTDGKVHGHGKASGLMGIKQSALRNRMDRLGIPYGRRKKGERVKEIDANAKI